MTIHRRTGRVWPVLSHLIRCIRLIDYSHMGLVPRTAVLVVRCHLVLYAVTSLLKACPRWVVVRLPSLYVFHLVPTPARMHCYSCISIYRHPCTHTSACIYANTIVICIYFHAHGRHLPQPALAIYAPPHVRYNSAQPRMLPRPCPLDS